MKDSAVVWGALFVGAGLIALAVAKKAAAQAPPADASADASSILQSAQSALQDLPANYTRDRL